MRRELMYRTVFDNRLDYRKGRWVRIPLDYITSPMMLNLANEMDMLTLVTVIKDMTELLYARMIEAEEIEETE